MSKCARQPNFLLNLFVRISLMVGILIGSSACKSGPQELHFETMARTDFSAGYIVFDSAEPGLIVFAKPEDISNLQLNTQTSNEKLKLQQLNYSKYFALLVLEGREPDTGHSVKITRITRSENIVTVYADFLELPQNLERAAIMTYPYHLVAVRKTGGWGRVITFNLVVGYGQAASVSHFIPSLVSYPNE